MGESTSGAAPGADDLTVVHLMRHGEVHNPDGVLYGRLDGFHLSDLGHEMARLVATHLQVNDITHVVASPLERAQQTAAPIAADHDVEIVTDARVIESENEFEGRSVGPRDLLHPRNWHLFTNITKPSPTRAMRPAATRPSSSATSCRSGRCATSSRAGASGTTRASASARWRR
jgi:hypothetical protein